MAGLARTCVTVLVTAAGLVTACGHLPFDELPVAEDGLVGAEGGAYFDANLDGRTPDPDGGVGDGGNPPPVIEDSGVPIADGGHDGSVCDECNILHVSASATGNGDGSKLSPFRTIQSAIDATNDTIKVIHITGGTYTEKVTVSKKGLAITGGYVPCDAGNKVCPWVQVLDNLGAPKDETIIQTKDEPSAGDLGFASLVVQGDADNTTELSYLHVVGRNVGQAKTTIAGSIGALVLGATPVFNKVILEGGRIGDPAGSLLSRRSIGLFVANTKGSGEYVRVNDSHLLGSSTSSTSAGLWLDAVGGNAAKVKIIGTTIAGDTGASSYGVYVNACTSDTIIETSFITSSAASGASEGDVSWGVHASTGFHLWQNRINWGVDPGKPFCNEGGAALVPPKVCGGVRVVNAQAMDIESNAISGVRAPLSAGVYARVALGSSATISLNGNVLVASAAESSVPAAAVAVAISEKAAGGTKVAIRNNILLGGAKDKSTRYGIFEVNDPSASGHPTSVTNNLFWDVDYAYATWDKTTSSPYPEPNTAPIGAGVLHDNIKGDPAFQADGIHLKGTSPCVGKAAYDAGEIMSLDIDGDARKPGTMDIGADEVP